jgi:hypothetical protein
MIEGHTPVTIDRFLGLYSTGSDDHVPQEHFIDTLNCISDGSYIRTRDGSIVDTETLYVLRFHIYKKLGETPHILYLNIDGSIYDTQNAPSPILTIPGMIDFNILEMYNRCYITPHDRVTGLAGEKVYVYDGTGVARPAAGAAPTGFTLTVTDTVTSGNVEAGCRLYAVAYETASGFITAPGPTIFTSYTSAGGFSIEVSNIPIGPEGTVARHLICTKIIDSYDGNQDAVEYFFIPFGRIGDNSTTTYTVNFFDQDLLSSADYLFDQLSEIPAALGLVDYQGTMVTYGENLYTYIVRVSKPGQPESFNSELGFVTVEPGDSTGVKACVEYRSQLFICKSKRTGVTQLVPNEEAAYWNYTSVDRSVGTEVYGIGTILDVRGNTIDYFVVADRSGLLLFDGSFRVNLTAKISSIWSSINQAAFNKVQVAIDPVNGRIYCLVPTGTSFVPNLLLVGDVGNGWSAESIRWFKWSFPVEVMTINVDTNYSTQEVVFKYGAVTGNIYRIDSGQTSDAGNAIDSYFQTALLSPAETGNECTFTGLVLRAKGNGSLQITLSGEDGSDSFSAAPLTLSTAPGRALQRNLNYVNSKCSVKLRTSNFGEYFSIHKFILYASKLWEERPQV